MINVKIKKIILVIDLYYNTAIGVVEFFVISLSNHLLMFEIIFFSSFFSAISYLFRTVDELFPPQIRRIRLFNF